MLKRPESRAPVEGWIRLLLGLRQTINGATIEAAEVSPYSNAAELVP